MRPVLVLNLFFLSLGTAVSFTAGADSTVALAACGNGCHVLVWTCVCPSERVFESVTGTSIDDRD